MPVHLVSMTRLDREAKTEGHQGVMALANALETVRLDDLLAREEALSLGL